MSQTPPRRPPDPVRAPLAEARRALLRLHKSLIDAERAAFEREHGALSGPQLLGALLEDPFFQWLRPFSRLVAEMDEAIFSREPVEVAHARALLRRAHAVAVAPTGGDDGAPSRYAEALRRDPAVRLAHAEHARHLAAALEAYGPEP